MNWLGDMRISDGEAFRILAVSRRAEDDAQVCRGLIADIRDGVAIVKRWGWHEEPLPDYPVMVRSRTAR